MRTLVRRGDSRSRHERRFSIAAALGLVDIPAAIILTYLDVLSREAQRVVLNRVVDSVISLLVHNCAVAGRLKARYAWYVDGERSFVFREATDCLA